MLKPFHLTYKPLFYMFFKLVTYFSLLIFQNAYISETCPGHMVRPKKTKNRTCKHSNDAIAAGLRQIS